VSALELTAFERAVITTILRPSHPVMDALRGQLAECQAIEREFTGVGFFTSLTVPSSVPAAPVTRERLHLGEVAASMAGLEHGAGFVLFVDHGRLHLLEGFSNGPESWPDRIADWAVTPITPFRGPGVESDLEQVENARNQRPSSG
jgi:hypothetical protein